MGSLGWAGGSWFEKLEITAEDMGQPIGMRKTYAPRPRQLPYPSANSLALGGRTRDTHVSFLGFFFFLSFFRYSNTVKLQCPISFRCPVQRVSDSQGSSQQGHLIIPLAVSTMPPTSCPRVTIGVLCRVHGLFLRPP